MGGANATVVSTRSRALPARWSARVCACADLLCPSHGVASPPWIVVVVPVGGADRLRLISTSGWRRAEYSPDDVVAMGLETPAMAQ
ncbi:hypothetical protein AM571_PC01924 (plasmid) [Rhizobium etli 8C-3]|uniref:Uncharacterized protein n=1 Tax=Rhizobium etli 8C-3 TaxID=538025 RepID=A0A1L5PHI5_RHIET|nr:hypothetical protein AM571_PC01924 [Rhizobium etli 8C-3]